jgi:hypothetical protein
MSQRVIGYPLNNVNSRIVNYKGMLLMNNKDMKEVLTEIKDALHDLNSRIQDLEIANDISYGHVVTDKLEGMIALLEDKL